MTRLPVRVQSRCAFPLTRSVGESSSQVSTSVPSAVGTQSAGPSLVVRIRREPDAIPGPSCCTTSSQRIEFESTVNFVASISTTLQTGVDARVCAKIQQRLSRKQQEQSRDIRRDGRRQKIKLGMPPPAATSQTEHNGNLHQNRVIQQAHRVRRIPNDIRSESPGTANTRGFVPRISQPRCCSSCAAAAALRACRSTSGYVLSQLMNKPRSLPVGCQA